MIGKKKFSTIAVREKKLGYADTDV
jgi:hypothetical protein